MISLAYLFEEDKKLVIPFSIPLNKISVPIKLADYLKKDRKKPITEGGVTAHLKKNWGKYAVGAGVAALAEPELSYGYHKKVVKRLADEIQNKDTNYEQKIRKTFDIFKHAKQAENANERNIVNHRDQIWTDKNSGQEDHVKQKYNL